VIDAGDLPLDDLGRRHLDQERESERAKPEREREGGGGCGEGGGVVDLLAVSLAAGSQQQLAVEAAVAYAQKQNAACDKHRLRL